MTSEGKEVYLREVWPSREEVQQVEEQEVISSIFRELRARMEVRRMFSSAPYMNSTCRIGSFGSICSIHSSK